ncbi:MAG: glycosyltransferase family 2 protein [Lewinellaceae bacterium]|nr:glycosyltransferase family 2 protein [Saprospiraceae bacterium]MCB9317307.1 glycosyltransferase family 2 protein [Lewinellaceae bacterium]MCB9331786.1 glycosyltransferase family 2 protein [Lewinellaceae bacterium]
MKTAGFTFIRNALLYDYPVVEAITSILPVCDYFVVAVGKSDDETLDLVRSIGDPKIHILETVWDDSLREGGQVLAEETNKAFDAIPQEYDWCFYIQADECVHEADLPAIRTGMARWLDDPATEGLLFKYRHFYGSYDFIGASRRWYRREVRIIRNDKRIRSYRDAQGFRIFSPLLLSPGLKAWAKKKGRPEKLHVRQLDAHIHHYGWVKHPAAQQRKQFVFNRLWLPDEKVRELVGDADVYDYDGTEPLERYDGTHPAVMLPRIQAMNWRFSGDPLAARWGWKNRLSRALEKYTGWRPGEYKNYTLLR